MGSTTSVPDELMMITSRPAARCSAIRSTASSYTIGSTISSSVSATIRLTGSTSQPLRAGHVGPHRLHLVVVSAGHEVGELRVRAPEHVAPTDQAPL